MLFFQLFAGLLLLVHWIGCIWFLLVGKPGDWVPPKDLDMDTRVEGVLWTKSDFYDYDITKKYVTVFYYAILTMMGNEIAPRDTTQTAVASVIIITGAVVAAFIFGNMAALMNQLNSKSTVADEQLDLAHNTMRSI